MCGHVSTLGTAEYFFHLIDFMSELVIRKDYISINGSVQLQNLFEQMRRTDLEGLDRLVSLLFRLGVYSRSNVSDSFLASRESL